MKQQEIQELKILSIKIGKNPLLTQGAGGNTSLKDHDVLLVKASGKWLSRALDEPIFVSLKLSHVLEMLKGGDSNDFTILSDQEYPGLRPSIETTVHAIMPQRIVLHMHSINTLSYAVRKDGKAELAKRLKGISWDWIPYCRPGIPLAKAIENLSEIPNVLILQNHGLVIAGNSCKEAENLLKDVENRLEVNVRSDPKFNQEELKTFADLYGLKLPRHPQIHSLATDPQALTLVNRGVLYPDQAVFLGIKPHILFLNGPSEEKKNASPFVLIPGKGVLVNPTISQGTEAMLLCHALLLQRLCKDTQLNPLPEQEVFDLMNWEAEKFRQHLDKR